jgi:twitching motility protein PilT
MSRLEQLLTKAMEMRAGEMWMAPGQPTRVRIGRDWRDLSNETWAPHETKALLSSPLSEFDKREFFDRGFWTGGLRLVGRPLQLQLQITDQGIAGSFRWRGNESLDWDSWALPGHSLEVITRTRGMSVVCGPGYSGKSSLLFLMMQKLGAGATQLVHFYSETAQTEMPARISSFPLKSLPTALQSSADVIIVDNPSVAQWPLLLDLAESGRHLVFSMTAVDLLSGLERWRHFHLAQSRRGLDCLQMGIGTRLVSGLETTLVPAVELLLVQHKLRAPLREGNWNIIDEEMKVSGEKTGMRTLNQSLLQLLLRRKIEMRTAFAESQSPDEFDQLLKKVGI